MKIFVTVGSIHPFDRLISAVDEWVEETQFAGDVLAQFGNSSFQAKSIETTRSLSPNDYSKIFSESDLIVGHAGMGTMITALDLGKPIIVMPRSAALGEHDNDHQFATVQHFQRGEWIQIAEDEAQLKSLLTAAMRRFSDIKESEVASWPPDPVLISKIREFIQQ